MSKEKRKAWRCPRRRRAVVPKSSDGTEEIKVTYNYEFSCSNEVELKTTKPKLIGKLQDLARLVWEPDYSTLFELEQEALEENNGLITEATLVKQLPDPSTYQQRGLGKKSQRDQEIIEGTRARSVACRALRQANQKLHTFSVLVHSLEALGKRHPKILWRRATLQRELVSRRTAQNFLKLVMQVRACSLHIATRVVD